MHTVRFPVNVNPIETVKHLGGKRKPESAHACHPPVKSYDPVPRYRGHYMEYDSIRVTTMGGQTHQGSNAIVLWEMQQKARRIRDLKSLGVSEEEIMELVSA